MAQFGRALRSGRRGRKFESCRLDFIFSLFLVNAGIAQSVEHFTRNEGVVSSSLISSSTRSLISFQWKRDQAFFRAGKVSIEEILEACFQEISDMRAHPRRSARKGTE